MGCEAEVFWGRCCGHGKLVVLGKYPRYNGGVKKFRGTATEQVIFSADPKT